jgi:cytochrome c oxidase subunit 4
MAHPVTTVKTYSLVFAGLIGLTALTLATALAPIGNLHTPMALTIAIVKAALVVLFFMHALHSSRLTWVVILAALFMFAVLIALTMAEYMTRTWSTV